MDTGIKYCVSTKYHKLHPSELPRYATLVRKKMNNLPANYSVDLINRGIESELILKKMLSDYKLAYANYALAKDIDNFLSLTRERDKILNFLDNVADLVNSISDGDPEIIRSYGLYPKKLKENYAL